MTSNTIGIQEADPAWAWEAYSADKDGWNRQLAAHLLRRACFGATSKELDEATNSTPTKIVDKLIELRDDQGSREANQLAKTIVQSGSSESLAAAWLYRILHSDNQLTEKTTVFWHGHFATSAAKVEKPALMHDQISMLREHALGDFRQMVQRISKDPAMLIYLDSVTNRKRHPNENYAREVMELFCLGEGNYTENDVVQLARCFTGWEIRRDAYRFNRFQHDFGEKKILGKSGKMSGEEAIDLILAQDAAPRFIASKLVRYFVFDEPAPSDKLIQPLADELRKNNLRIGPTVRRILLSKLFYSTMAVGRKIRTPVEYSAGILRCLEGSANVQSLSNELETLGQRLYFPPNVKGWDGGRTWINSSTLLGRANLMGKLLGAKSTRFGKTTIDTYIAKQGHKNPEETVRWLEELILATPLPKEVRGQLVKSATDKKSSAKDRWTSVLHTLCTQPEVHLA